MAEAIRRIRFAMTADTVSPEVPQAAGHRGEHNATEVVLVPGGTLADAAYGYRVEYTDGAGGYDTTDLLPLTGGEVCIRLPQAWTCAGGVAQIRLSAVRLNENHQEEIIAFSPPGLLLFAPRAEGAAGTREAFTQGLAGLIAETREAAGQAADAAERAETEARVAAEAAREATRAAAGADEATAAARDIRDITLSAQEQITTTVNTFTKTTVPEAEQRIREAGHEAETVIETKGAQVQQAVAATGQEHTAAALAQADRAEAMAAQAVNSAGLAATEAERAAEAAMQATAEADRVRAIDPYGKGAADSRFAPALRGTAAGLVAHMDDVAAFGGFSRTAVCGVTTETGTGDKGPGNPYTITGAAPTRMTAANANLFDFNSRQGRYNIAEVDYTQGYLKTRDMSGFQVFMTGPIGDVNQHSDLTILAGMTYTLSFDVRGSVSSMAYIGVACHNGSTLETIRPRINLPVTTAYQHHSITFTSDLTLPHASLIGQMPNEMAGYYELNHIAISVGADEVAGSVYESYAAQGIALPTLAPLYGDGKVWDEYDTVTGVETRRWGRLVLDGAETWASSPAIGAYSRYTLLIRSAKPNGACDSTHLPRGQAGMLSCSFGGNYFVASVPTADYPDIASFKAYLAAQAAAGTPVAVVYELADPVITQHEPQTIVPIPPVCNLYADAGTMDVGYPRDLTRAFDRLEALLQGQ